MSQSPPVSSYVVWHTQRTGSTLLCTTLDATGVAGHPDEWPESGLVATADDAQLIRDRLWSKQTTPNGVLGVKWSYHEPSVESFFRVFKSRGGTGREAWDSVFPNCRHIVTTRRDKIRLAVSWWKSISGGPGHLSLDGSALPWQMSTPEIPADLPNAYNFNAIRSLVLEAVRREAGIQGLMQEFGVSPLSVTYEDFVANYEETIETVLGFIGQRDLVAKIPPPLLSRTADHVNEAWVARFLSDLKIAMG